MDLGFTYMGTKRQLANRLADVISCAPPGPLLDAFAGMSAVGNAVALKRPVWCNDIQSFASTVAGAFFTSSSRPKVSSAATEECNLLFADNREKLHRAFASQVAQEQLAYSSGSLTQICKVSSNLLDACTSPRAVRKRTRYRRLPTVDPYCLFAITYSGGYIGLQQAIDIDSLRFAIDGLLQKKLINKETYRWMLIALCRALARASNSTGHFAQYLSVKEHTKPIFLTQRQKSIWHEWQRALDSMHPLGTKQWRRSNKVFQSESIQLLRRLRRSKIPPAVVYCDPPYKADHYSRYYHLVETLILYDYPQIDCKGQYRPDRFYSPFSIKTKVRDAFKELIDAAAGLSSVLVLSYPDNGLLGNARDELVRLLHERFSKVEIAAELKHEHSTLGASKGVEREPVTELVFLARG
jgi:adenine-specific DNA-methyltransferase